ncbi:MAG: hypothetical protein Q8P32_04860 [Candidatus Komeilibacteria bacterium]|nr:hypothetical protein [Candidatus Komeilibacteria bacterium]
MSTTLITSRDPKGLHAVGLFEAVYNKFGLNDQGAQRLNERGDEFQNGIRKLIAELSAIFDFDKSRDGWTLLEDDASPLPGNFSIEAVEFLKEGETWISGEEMTRRAKEELNADSSQHLAEWLLKNQSKIPVELRGTVLVFTATKWQALDGDRSVAFLIWGGGRWYLSFFWLHDGLGSDFRLVRLREQRLAA